MAETVLRIGRRIDSMQESDDPPLQEEPPQEEPQAEEKQAPRTPTSQIRLPPITGVKRLEPPRSPTADEGKFAVESVSDSMHDSNDDGDAGESKTKESTPQPVTHVNKRLKAAIAKLSKPSFANKTKKLETRSFKKSLASSR